MSNSFLTQVTQAVTQIPVSLSPKDIAIRRNICNSELDLIGLPVPQQRTLLKGLMKNLDPKSKSTLLLWDHVWKNSPFFEVKALPLFYYEALIKDKKTALAFWPTTKSWAKDLENWAHSDVLSKCYAALLEFEPTRIYPTLQTWNRSKNPWLRRQSVVSLLCYSALRKKVLPKTKLFPLVESLLADDHYYVQKGIGWTLRELSNAYPDATWTFLKKHVLSISSHAFSAAVEKIPSTQKEELKSKRKAHRTKSRK